LTYPTLSDNEKVLVYLEEEQYAIATEQLLKSQLNDWEALAECYNRLSKVKVKSCLFDDFQIKLQFNPGRMKSTSAEVGEKEIKKRSCFLCAENLPNEQRGIKLLDDYILLCNPYPIFPNHFTIVSITHKQQDIKSSFADFIEVSRMLSDKYSLIYNGPRCGASAPDHLHFQAGTKGYIPIENEFHSLIKNHGEEILNNRNIAINAVDDNLRRFISIESKDENILRDSFDQFYHLYTKIKSEEEEPMMNIICNYRKEYGWRVIIFVRSKHRSSHYYLENEKKIMISPAAIDLGGICITPVEKDFKRIDKKIITEVFKQISLQRDDFEKLINLLKEKYN
jgi:ATP adenylyltransferase/5',5'''-P-1,P-4-tetraphosphate phosphorylase II